MKTTLKWHVAIGGFLVYMFDAVEISILAISLPSIRQSTGISLFQGGLLATVSWLGIAVSGLAMGIIADTYGRRRALLMSLLVFGAATAAFAFAGGSYELMLALRFIGGLGLGGVWAILAAYVAETWPAQSRSRVTLGVLSSYPVGAALAAAVGGFFLPDWQSVFLWCGVAVIVPLLYVFFLIPESPEWQELVGRRRSGADRSGKRPSAPVKEIFKGDLLRQTIFGTLAASFALFAYIALLTWLPSYLSSDRGLTLEQTSRYIVLFNVGIFASYFIFGVVADKVGERTALIVSLTGVATMLVVYSLATNAVVLLWLSPIMGLFIVFSGLLGSYFSRIYPVHIRTTGAGFCFNVGRGVAAFSPLLTAGIATGYGFSTMLVVCAAIFGLAVAAVLCLPRRTGRGRPATADLSAEGAQA
jgi:MFS family permease